MKQENNDPNHPSTERLKKRVGAILHKKRIEKNYTLKAVALDTGISEGTLSEIENGRYNFNIDLIQKLAHYYGMSLDELLPIPTT
jgi:transcriptional regulator with XRE-family HTH domain